jgi:PPOX class probable F420-dependent enzyme
LEVHCLVAQLIGTIDTHGKIYEMIIIIRYVFYFIVLRQITEPVARLLKGKNFAYLSTLMKDGSPQVTPTWVDIDKDGNSILINAAEGRTKHKNVSRDSRVAISISDQNNPYNMVSIRGRIIEQISEGADEHIDRLAKKYLGMDKYPYRSPNEKRVILKIKPEKVFHQQPPK